MSMYGQPYPPPPQQQQQQAQQPQQQPQQYPGGLQAAQQQLMGWFQTADIARTGRLEVAPLQMALMNGEWPPLKHSCVQSMMQLFDPRGVSVDFGQFTAMVAYIRDWFRHFAQFDRDRSGTVDKNELKQALQAFGYNLSEQVQSLVVRKYDRSGKGVITFDDFMECCNAVRGLTEFFKSVDAQKNGWATMSYDQYLSSVFRHG